jgi:hypothetical protein
MYTNTTKCSNCGKTLCCQTIHQIYRRYQERLAALLAEPEPDRERIAFLMFILDAIHRRYPELKDSAS